MTLRFLFRASEALRPDGTVTLPSGMVYVCPTANTSAQTGASTVRTGFAAHAPRAVSRDGVSWGLLVEKGATNLIANQDLATWVDANTPILHGATTPAGAVEFCDVEDDDVAAAEYKRLLAFSVDPNPRQLVTSLWLQNMGPEQAIWQIVLDGSAVPLAVVDTSADSDWRRASHAATVTPSGSGSLEARARPRNVTADVGACRYWGMQLETGLYPTSFIGADNATFTRAAGKVTVPTHHLARRGYFDQRWTLAPHFASNEFVNDATIWRLDDDNRLYLRASDKRIVLVTHGQTIESAALSFSRYDPLAIEVSHTPAERRMRVNGVDVFGAPVDALPDTPTAYILSEAGGALESFELQSFDWDVVPLDLEIQAKPTTDHANKGASRFIQHFRHKPNIEALARSYLDRVQEAEDLAWDVIQAMLFENALGKQLDIYGSLLHLARFTKNDVAYKLALRARLLILRSAATPNELIRIANLLTDNKVTRYSEEYPCRVTIQLNDLTANVNQLIDLIEAADAAGIALYLVFSKRTQSKAFTLRYSGKPNDPDKGLSYSGNPQGGHLSGVITK